MAHKKGQGSSRNGRDSNGQRRGTKVYGGEFVTAGSILVRQVGTLIHAGRNVGRGRDHTLFATSDGHVKYVTNKFGKKCASIVPVVPGSVMPPLPSAN